MLLDEGLGINSLFWSLCTSTVDICSLTCSYFKSCSSPFRQTLVSSVLFLSLSCCLPCFQWCHAHQQPCTLSEVREGSSHIFHPLSVSDWVSALVVERRDGRKESRQGVKEGGMESWSYFGWGLGKCRKPKAQTRRKPDQGRGGKKGGLCRNLCSRRVAEPTDNSVARPTSKLEKHMPRGSKEETVVGPF